MSKFGLLLLSVFILSNTACKKEGDPPPPPSEPLGRYIGELWGGGIICHLDTVDGVQHGLIMSTKIFEHLWSTIDSAYLIGVDDIDRDTNGWINTLKIIEQLGEKAPAAQECRNYRGGEYMDWYLPSVAEFGKIAIHRKLLEKRLTEEGFPMVFMGIDEFWTSNEYYVDTMSSNRERWGKYALLYFMGEQNNHGSTWLEKSHRFRSILPIRKFHINL